MAIIDKIKIDNLTARKNSDSVAANLLTTLYSEITTVAKNDGNRAVVDNDCVTCIKKFIKGIDEIVTICSSDKYCNDSSYAAKLVLANSERDILMKYLPTQLSAEELSKVIAGIVGELPVRNTKQVGAVMKTLKSQYAGLYDGLTASRIIAEQLA